MKSLSKSLALKALSFLIAIMLICTVVPTTVFAASYSKTLYEGEGFELKLTRNLEATNPQSITFNVYVDDILKVDGLLLTDIPKVGTHVSLTEGYSYTAECSGTNSVIDDVLVLLQNNKTITFHVSTKKKSDKIKIADDATTYGTFCWDKATAEVSAYKRAVNVYVNGEFAYTQNVYTPTILTNSQNSPQFYFEPNTDLFNSDYNLDPYLTLGTDTLADKDLDVYLTTKCLCGRDTCLCGGQCDCPKDCTCDDCMGIDLGDHQINTGYGIIGYREPSKTFGGYNLTVEIYVNGEKQYTSDQLRIRVGLNHCLDFEPAEGYYFANSVNNYDIKTKHNGSSWVKGTGYIMIIGMEKSSRNYDNRLKIYLYTFENQFNLNVERDPGEPLNRVKGYTGSYVAFDPKTNSSHTWTQEVTDFSAVQQMAFPKQTDITITGICEDGYQINKWRTTLYDSGVKIREPNGEADNDTAKGNPIILYVTASSLTSVPLYIEDVSKIPKYTLTYDVNTGIANSGPATETDLLAQTGHTLATAPVPMHVDVNDLDVIFIGWSKAADSKIYGKDDSNPTNIITTVDIVDKNVTVYAVWGYDKNSNGTPDVYEDLYSLSYDENGGDTASVPATQANLLPATYSLNTTTKPIHADVNSKKVAFMGWSKAADSKIYSKSDDKPTNIIATATITNANVTVYAVWGYDENGNGTPDVYEELYSLTYDANGGDAGTVPPRKDGILPQTVTLNSEIKPIHADVNSKKVLFIGWSKAADSKIYDKDDDKPTNITTTVNIVDKNVFVYAVWGFDANSNGTPDVYEDLYSLSYNANGGNEVSVPAKQTDLLPDTYTLNTTTKPTRADVNSKKVVFIGWSKAADNKIYDKDDNDPTNIITTVKITDANVTVYAVWGYDVNGNGTPDVYEELYSLSYNANGGNADSVPAKQTDLLPDTSYTLNSTTKPKHNNVGGKKVVFIGWSKAADNKIYDKDDNLPTNIITTAKITNANVTVYAVWGYDVNGNGTPDVYEELYSLSYNANGGNAASVPAIQANLLPDTYTLNTTTKPTRNNVSGKKVVFIGWSKTADNKIYAKDDNKPSNIITTAKITDENVTVYAVWGYDVNGNSTPDVYEDLYSLSYDANGGNADSVPAKQTDLLPDTYTLNTTTKPTRNNVGGKKVLFIGWSKAADNKIYDKDDNAPTNIITTAKITNANVTVYAVWGYDENGNGTPDVYDDLYSLSYNANGGNTASVPAKVNGLLSQTVTLDTTTKPTHNNVNSKKVIFIGWSKAADSNIYAKGDNKPSNIITTATITNANVTVYAVWGYDENGNSTPDVYESLYSLSYDANGGNGVSVPTKQTNLLPDTYTLNTTTKPTRNNVSGKKVIFIGWSKAADNKIYAKGDNKPSNIITTAKITDENVTVYAVWGYDENGNGTPDVYENLYSLSYDANGGDTASVPAKQTDLLPDTYTLNTTTKPAHADLSGKKVVFIGWSKSSDKNIYAKGNNEPINIITTAKITDANVTVYAVWGYDVNGNGTPDVYEELYNLSYDANGGDTASVPAKQTNLLPNTYTLDSTAKPTHADASNKKVVFIGWSNVVDSTIYAKGNNQPSNIITTTTITNANVTVYAVWGYDENGNGTPDVYEDLFSLSYDANGGDADSVPQKVDGLLSQTVTLDTATKPTHADVNGKKVVFIGWSNVANSNIFANGDNKPSNIITTVKITDANVTVCAVWGYDENGNGIPDVYEEAQQEQKEQQEQETKQEPKEQEEQKLPVTGDKSNLPLRLTLLLTSLLATILLVNKKRLFDR